MLALQLAPVSSQSHCIITVMLIAEGLWVLRGFPLVN